MNEHAKLRWRCRRGVLELDLLLLHYLDSAYREAPAEERQAFLQLLDLEDNEVLHYLMEERPPADPALAELLAKLRCSIKSNP